MTEANLIEAEIEAFAASWAAKVKQFAQDRPEEFEALCARNLENWAKCTYEHSPAVRFCNKCGWNE